ncbi:MAG TPA: GspH/FimT family pseudopilin [Candidatus Methylomirabilis sp.]|nr:GspH/FimT family pseudopilin [Candidatus Methylomirabilis sp.]
MKPNREVGKWMATGPATGFTLPELLLTVGLVGIVSAAALPTLAGTVQSYRVRTAAWQVAGDLRLARQKAVSSNHRHRVCFSDCGGAVPADGYLIQREEGSRWEIDTAVQPSSKGVQVRSNATITFAHTGEAAGGTVTLLSGPASFQVRTHFTGKVTVCKGSCL